MHMFPGPFPWFKDAAKQAAGDDFDVRRTRSHRTPECRSGPLQWPKNPGFNFGDQRNDYPGGLLGPDVCRPPPHSGTFWACERASSVCLLSDNGTAWNSRLTQAATV